MKISAQFFRNARATLDGEDVSGRCTEADDETGVVLLLREGPGEPEPGDIVINDFIYRKHYGHVTISLPDGVDIQAILDRQAVADYQFHL